MTLLTILCVTIIIIGCHSAEIGKPNSQSDTFIDHTAYSSRISNGHAATDNQFPYQVSILSQEAPEMDRIIHSGSLINPSWVLTGARVVNGYNIFYLRFGSNNRREGGIEQISYSTIAHDVHDIALISIPSPLIFGPTMSAIRLPADSQVHDNFINRQATISGWGRSEVAGPAEVLLRWVHVRPIGNDECFANLGIDRPIYEENICAIGYDNPGTQGACGGDTGGPLVIHENGIPTQIGIFLYVRNQGCFMGYPGVYMRTANFLEWINVHTGIAIRPN